MVWQAGVVGFFEFYRLFVPSLVNWLVPAFFMSFAVPKLRPPAPTGTGAASGATAPASPA